MTKTHCTATVLTIYYKQLSCCRETVWRLCHWIFH